MEERRREIQADRQSKRAGVYRRHACLVWMTVDLSTAPRQKRVKIEILSQQLRIAYAIIFQPHCRPLDLILYTFPFPISTTPTLTATLSPPGTLEFGPELLLTPLWKPPLIRRIARE